MSKSKTNPIYHLRRSDIQKLKSECCDQAIRHAQALFYTALANKEEYNKEDLQRIFKEVMELSTLVAEKYVTIEGLIKALKREYDIDI